MSDVLVEAIQVSRRFRSASGVEILALDGVSLGVARNDLVALTGPSGSGKSTLLALLGALDRPSEGRIVFDGSDLRGVSEGERARVRRRVGFVFQATPTLRGASAWENVALPLVPRGIPAAERRARAGEALDRVGLSLRAESLPEELSGGERQRMGVARALVGGPELLLADEPTASLDGASAGAIAGLLVQAHAGGCAVVVATHDEALLSRATRIVTLEAGRVVSVGSR